MECTELFSYLLGFPTLVKTVHDQNKNIYGILKFTIIKVAVAFIGLQGVALEFLITFGGGPYNDDDVTTEDKTVRGYCKFWNRKIEDFFSVLFTFESLGMLILIEFVALIIPFVIGFGSQITKADEFEGNMAAPINYSIGGFLCEVLKFHDVYGTLSLREAAVVPQNSPIVAAVEMVAIQEGEKAMV